VSPQSSFHSARLMGAWIIDMADLDAAHAAISQCKAATAAVIEVRHTLWGVQVRTESQQAADCLKASYSPTTAAPVALAA
jgi:hypothetical protein